MYTARPSNRESGALETRVAGDRPISSTVMYFAASRRTSPALGGFIGFGIELRAMIVDRVSILPLRMVRSGTESAAGLAPAPVPPFGFNFGPAENAAGRDT